MFKSQLSLQTEYGGRRMIYSFRDAEVRTIIRIPNNATDWQFLEDAHKDKGRVVNVYLEEIRLTDPSLLNDCDFVVVEFQ